MASSSPAPTVVSSSNASLSPNPPRSFYSFGSQPVSLASHCLRPLYPSIWKPKSRLYERRSNPRFHIKAQALDFSGSIFQDGFGSNDDSSLPSAPGLTALEEKEEPPCPPGLRRYETMVVLRPDMSEDERLALTQKYEENNKEKWFSMNPSSYFHAGASSVLAGGGMYIEVFNRGVIPLAYTIRKRNRDGELNTYLDGIYLLFTYFTKPESMGILEETLKADDDAIRSMSFKVRKRKY